MHEEKLCPVVAEAEEGGGGGGVKGQEGFLT